MIKQEQNSDPQSSSVVCTENATSTELCTQVNEVIMERGFVPKIRKPYTITNPREKWSKEEHEKFLEALRLHGRAWKKIEAHIGTKKAVQIRSHAQKFFSKIARGKIDISASSSTAPIEIPPPRPKKKPVHPYPRKRAGPTDHLTRSASPNSSIYENRSPTSVLSPLASEDSPALNGSPSLTSFAEERVLPSEDTEPRDDVHMSPLVTNDLVSVKLELFSSLDSVNTSEPVATIFKLFGKDIVVSSKPSVSSPSSHTGEDVLPSGTFLPKDIDVHTSKNPGDHRTIHCVDGAKNHAEKPVPPLECHVTAVGNIDNNRDVEIQESRCENQLEKENKHLDEADMEVEPTLLEKTLICNNTNKGFVPYNKRCLSEENMQSSTENIGEKEPKTFGI